MVARKLILPVLIAGLIQMTALAEAADAAGCSADASTAGNAIFTQAACDEHAHSETQPTQAASNSSAYYTDFRTERVCYIRSETGFQADGCPRSDPYACQPGQVLYQRYGLHDGVWEPIGRAFCSGDALPGLDAPVTPELVAHAFQRIPLPALRAITQPADKTLINFDTIFYVQAEPLHRTLTLLGQRVDLAITPSTFRWVHGDGTVTETTTPGAAYPAKDVVHRYQQAHLTVSQHVEIIWTARWSLDGGPYQDVEGTVTTVGPDTPLRIAEATPALSGYGH